MTILAPYQQTPEGQAAILRAVAEARLRDTDLVVLTAPAQAGGDVAHEVPELTEAGDDVRVTVRVAVRADDLAGEVVDLATELDAEMIVIGMRRRSPVGKLFLGSTAQDVLLNASVPVLTVRVP
jgi:nucleotide-binding universal stress UspA family protein